MMLRNVDDERVARVVGEQVSAHSAGRCVRRAINLTDLVQPYRGIEHRFDCAVAGEYLKRAREDRAGLGVQRQCTVIFEYRNRYAVMHQP